MICVAVVYICLLLGSNVTAFLFSIFMLQKFKEVISFDYDAESRNENEKYCKGFGRVNFSLFVSNSSLAP